MIEYFVRFYGSIFTERYLGNSNYLKTKKEIFDEARLELAKTARTIFKANQVKKEFFNKYQSLKKEDTEKFDLFCNQDIYDKNIFVDAEDIGADRCYSFTIGDDRINDGYHHVFYKVFSRDDRINDGYDRINDGYEQVFYKD
jgi:hypothetical protein